MEVIAAIASFIALGQALESGSKVVDKLRSLPEIRNEFMFLMNEVSYSTFWSNV